MSALSCTIDMNTLTASPFSLVFDDLVAVRVRAKNSIDYGDWSTTTTTGAKIRSIPDTMIAPTIASFADSSITVTWTALTSPDNGNSDILAYELVWDNGLNVVPTVELSNVLTTEYVVPTADIISGSTYRFAVRARNIYGSATAYSAEVSATAIDIPAKMDIPTVALNTVDATQVDISWTEPTYHGSAIDLYEVTFKTSSGTYVTDTTSCNPDSTGAITYAAQYTARKCTVPMSTIRTLTGLSVDYLI